MTPEDRYDVMFTVIFFLLSTMFILCFVCVCLCVCVYFHIQVFEIRGSSEGPPWDGLDEIFTQVPEKQGNTQRNLMLRDSGSI